MANEENLKPFKKGEVEKGASTRYSRTKTKTNYMNLQETIKSDNQIIRAIYNVLQAEADKVEFHQYDDVNIQSKKDFYIAISQAVSILIEGQNE